MYICYSLISTWAGAIILFTLLTKVILFPLSLIAQKNSIKMVKMQPQLRDLRERNAGNGALIAEETKALYKKEKYSTFKGILPLLVQIPLILGLIDVIYKPLRYLLRIDGATISALSEKTAELLGTTPGQLGYSVQLRVLEQLRLDPAAFTDIIPPGALKAVDAFNSSFLGLDLSQIPSLGSLLIVAPIASALSALVLCLVQNKYNVLQMEQGFVGKWGMTIFLVAFSGYFAYVLPCGLGLYWTAGNLLSVPVLAVCNIIYSPGKYIDYENRALTPKLTSAEKKAKKQTARELKAREKTDVKRFFAQEKRSLVIYSESNGYYKYFARLIDYIIAHSDITIHYVTSDPRDAIFEKAQSEPQLEAYYVGTVGLIAFMMKMDAAIVLMTLPDLETYHIKRSIVNKDIEYIYTDHGMTSFHLMLREGALDHFDTIFCYGPNHIEEVRETEKIYSLPEKTLVKTGFGVLDDMLEKVALIERKHAADETALPRVLIAPSWQRDNLLDFCLDDLMHGLKGSELNEKGFAVTIRPHPEYVKRFPDKMKRMLENYGGREGDGITVETDFSSNETVYTSDVVITDWSSIAQEFSYATKKPSLFINTPMKVMNPNWQRLSCVPLDISLRNEIGVSLNADAGSLAEAGRMVRALIKDKEQWEKRITDTLNANIYYIGESATSGGDYIIGRIKDKEWIERYGEA